VGVRRDEIRLMLQLTSPRRGADKLKYLAGSEAAMGAWIGDIPPETAAAAIREAIDRADRENPVGELPVHVTDLLTVLPDSPASADTSDSPRKADR
jgi:UDPglucose--hexose-1-phosphate uridylyltransferase